MWCGTVINPQNWHGLHSLSLLKDTLQHLLSKWRHAEVCAWVSQDIPTESLGWWRKYHGLGKEENTHTHTEKKIIHSLTSHNTVEQWDFVGQWIWQIIGRLPPTLMPVLGTWWLFQWNCSTQQDTAAFHGCSRYEGISCFLSDVGKNLSNNCKLGQGHSSGSTDGWKTWKRWNIALDLEASNYTKNPSLWQPLCNTVMCWTMCVCSIFSNPF